jgi:hypothetical protein
LFATAHFGVPRYGSAPRQRGLAPYHAACAASPCLLLLVSLDLRAPHRFLRPRIFEQLWEHIKKNKLQNKNNMTEIICDDTLRVLFLTDRMTMPEMNKLLEKHFREDLDNY